MCMKFFYNGLWSLNVYKVIEEEYGVRINVSL